MTQSYRGVIIASQLQCHLRKVFFDCNELAFIFC